MKKKYPALHPTLFFPKFYSLKIWNKKLLYFPILPYFLICTLFPDFSLYFPIFTYFPSLVIKNFVWKTSVG